MTIPNKITEDKTLDWKFALLLFFLTENSSEERNLRHLDENIHVLHVDYNAKNSYFQEPSYRWNGIL